MNNKNITYYKGVLVCQFQVDKLNKLNSSSNYWGNYDLLPRYKLYDFVEINENEYYSEIENIDRSCIVKKEVSPIEFYTKNDSFRLNATEIYLTPSIKSNDKDEMNTMVWDIASHTPNEYEDTFIAKHADSIHGIMQGNAFVLCDKTIKYDPIIEENSGCLNMLVFIAKPIVDIIFAVNSRLKKMINFVSTRLFGKAIINDLDNNSGCLNTMLPSGCTSSGCSSFGCGCLSFVFGLLLLLFGLMSLFKTCGSNQNIDQNRIIKDTVYIEKKIYDTIKVTKTDTLRFENKITKTNYESVNLPNVQFKTNDVELLEGSYKDIDALIEYLKKNNQIEAEIMGHTDNVGDPNSNIDLSQRRAEKIRDYMISKGISGAKVKAIGKGDTEPKTSNETAEGRMLNRRVEVKLSNKQVIKSEKKQIKNESE
jgi:outer membrane protein OmpA-like peptidoglycan-associated protein